MSYNVSEQTKKTSRFRKVLLAAFAFGCLFGAVSRANAQVTPPPTPTDITPPVGNTAFLLGHAHGTQGYVCLPTSTGASWTVNNARPEATLFTKVFGQDFEIITHFLSPNTNPKEGEVVPFGNATWQNSLDSSVVWAKAVGTPVTAGTDQDSCPNAGSISCLLLQSTGSLQGPAGGKVMTKVTFIQRLNTSGGSAPATGCSVSADVGKQTLVPYTADYYFYRGSQ